MKFINYTENRNIIAEAFSEVENMEPATEGWGKFLAAFLGGATGNALHWAFSATNLNQLTKNKDFVNYVKKTCDDILAQERRKDKSVTKECPNGPLKMFERWWHGSDDVPYFSFGRWLNWRSDWLDDKTWLSNIGGYNITFFYDTDHVDAAVVVLWSENKQKFIGVRLPEPKKGELQRVFRKEQ